MRIRMLDTRYGSEDGFVVHRYLQNKEYDVLDSMAQFFIRKGWAERKAS